MLGSLVCLLNRWNIWNHWNDWNVDREARCSCTYPLKRSPRWRVFVGFTI